MRAVAHETGTIHFFDYNSFHLGPAISFFA